MFLASRAGNVATFGHMLAALRRADSTAGFGVENDLYSFALTAPIQDPASINWTLEPTRYSLTLPEASKLH
jgi:hypothetical protein